MGCTWQTTVKTRFSFFFIVRTNCEVGQYWLRKIFIDDFFFQADQWECTSSPSFNQFSSSKERSLPWSSSLVSFIFIYWSIHLSSIFNKANCSFALKNVSQFIATSHTFQVYRYNEKCSLFLYLDVFENTWPNHESRTIAVHHGQQQRHEAITFLSPVNSTNFI